MTNLIALPEGTELVGDYRIERVLGAGGFGITYLATELALNRAVTIKEYFPSDFAARGSNLEATARSQGCAEDYRWGLERFIDEAQTLAKFDHHPNIVRLHRYFKANNTAYMVLHFEEGQSLKSWLKSLGRAPRQKELDALLAPLLDALELVHKADFLHRDIAPDNIMLRKSGAPVLIDFGSARGEMAAHSKTVSALVKPGYSPYEQYSEKSRQQGPWTDIYALGATLYHAVTGKRPPDSPSRMVKDEYVPAREAALSSYRPAFLKAIDRALALNIESRPQSIAAWRGDLLAPEPAARGGWLARGAAKKAGAAAAKIAEATHPLPDVEGPQGGMLDLVDELRRKTDPEAPKAKTTAPKAPVADAAGAASPGATAKLETAPPPPPAFLRRGKKKADDEPAPAAAKADPAAATPKAEGRAMVPVAAPELRRKPRPKAVRPFEKRSLRPLLFKLLIGAGVASAAVAMQDKLPHFQSPGGVMPSSQVAASGQPRAAIAMPLQTLKAHKSAATAVLYSDDGRSIVTAGADATLKVWSAPSGSLVKTIALGDGPATSVALAGKKALTGHGNGRIVLWDIERGDKLSTYTRNEASVWSVAFAGGADRFVASGHDWKVALWDAKTTTAPAHLFEGHDSAAQAVAYAGKGPWIASGGADRAVKLWNLDTLDLVRTYKGHKDFVAALAFSADGRLLASAGLDGGIRVWSTSSSRLHRVLSGHKGRVGGLAFSPAGDLLASAGDDGTVRLWDFKRGRTARALLGHIGPVRSVAFSPDGRLLASAGDDGTVKLWGMETLRLQARAERED